MDNLAPVLNTYDLPTKQYVDDKSSIGFYASSGRWAPAWGASKASAPIILKPNWIYAYRVVLNVPIQTLAIDNPGPGQGQPLLFVVYADTPPWPGAKLQTGSGLTTDLLGLNFSTAAIGKGSYWFAIHNIAAVDVPLRAFIERNPYSPGSIDATGANAFTSGITYNVGGITPPTTWPAGTGTDVPAISMLLRAT